jgi:hypothetical protein
MLTLEASLQTAVSEASSAARLVGGAHVSVGLLLIGLAVPLILQRVAMNRLYGVRVREAFASEHNWYAINRIGGWWLAGAGAGILVLGALVLGRPPASHAALLVLALAPVVIVLLTLVPVLSYARKLR